MGVDGLIPTALQLLVVVALGGMLASILARLVRGRLEPASCPACGRPRSRAYPRCRHCGDEADGRRPPRSGAGGGGDESKFRRPPS